MILGGGFHWECKDTKIGIGGLGVRGLGLGMESKMNVEY